MSERADTLVSLARKRGWQRGAELGILRAQTMLALLRGVPSIYMIGVDNWISNPNYQTAFQDTLTGKVTYTQAALDKFMHEAFAALIPFRAQCTVIALDTVAAAKLVPDASLDFVFIDADHSTEGVTRDLTAWTPKVRAGGAVLGHDVNWASVKQALHGKDHQVLPGHVWIIEK